MQPKWIYFFIVSLYLYQPSFGQNDGNLSLQQILYMGESNYPLIKSKIFETAAATKAVDISRQTFIPSLDASWQIGYATHNNISGMVFPQYVMPISGPPSSENNLSGVFGSAGSLLLNWQPLTFGQRESQTAFAQAGADYAAADAANQLFQYKIRLVNAYLDALTAEELVKVYQENLVRAETNLSTVNILVLNGIKPGVDTSLFQAEVARARIDLLGSKRNDEQAKIKLSELLATNDPLSIRDSLYFIKIPDFFVQNSSVLHPLLSLYSASVVVDKAKRKSLVKTSSPLLNVWGTTYARGSGINYDGSVNTFNGLGFQRVNYGLGVQLSMPLLQSIRIKPQVRQEDLLIRSGEEKVKNIHLQLDKQLQSADTLVQYALQEVNESFPLLQSEVYTYKTIFSRYNAGLANYADVVQAQYNLLKAKVENKTTYMAVWKALLYKSAVTGDLNLFLKQVK
jgi:outer membrane protein TolC